MNSGNTNSLIFYILFVLCFLAASIFCIINAVNLGNLLPSEEQGNDIGINTGYTKFLLAMNVIIAFVSLIFVVVYGTAIFFPTTKFGVTLLEFVNKYSPIPIKLKPLDIPKAPEIPKVKILEKKNLEEIIKECLYPPCKLSDFVNDYVASLKATTFDYSKYNLYKPVDAKPVIAYPKQPERIKFDLKDFNFADKNFPKPKLSREDNPFTETKIRQNYLERKLV